jgi:hypothetical protein
MRAIIYLFFTFIIFLFACQEDYTFIDYAGRFSVEFAEEPSIDVDTFQTALGQVELYTFLLELSTTHAQMITYSDYPIDKQYITDPYAFINGAKEGALESLNITQTDFDERIEFMGVPGVEVIGNNSEGLQIHYKLFLKGNRLYQLGVLTDGANANVKKGQDFLESFIFINN